MCRWQGRWTCWPPCHPHTCAGVRAALVPPMAACRALNHAVRPAPSLALHSVAPQTVRTSAWADGMKHSRCRARKLREQIGTRVHIEKTVCAARHISWREEGVPTCTCCLLGFMQQPDEPKSFLLVQPHTRRKRGNKGATGLNNAFVRIRT